MSEILKYLEERLKTCENALNCYNNCDDHDIVLDYEARIDELKNTIFIV